MRLSKFAIAFTLAVQAEAGVFRSPLQYDEKKLSESVFKDAQVLRSWTEHGLNAKRAEQVVLSGEKPHRVEFWDAPAGLGLLVPAALGNPTQPFRLLFDLAWDTLFVPSIDLDESRTGNTDLLRYDAKMSSTYVPSPERSYVGYAGVVFSGNITLDTFRIAGVEVEQQPFINALSATPIGWIHLWFGYDGALGFGPHWNRTAHPSNTSSPLAMMVSEGLLDSNVFAVDIPRGPRRGDEVASIGELSIGGINPAYESSEFAALEVIDYGDGWVEDMWLVGAQSITWENETHPIHKECGNLGIAAMTSFWYMTVPQAWHREIFRSIDPPPQCGFLCFIDCEARSRMPNLTIALGGHNFTITPFDYSAVMESEDGQRICTFDIYPTEPYLGTTDPILQKTIVLGRPFLNAFYSVFDLDKHEIRVAPAIK
ncbi:acid protease [Thozetella sp. PMI_491]|nr:acid protease [Thozetella sp. PMI_491]